MVNPMNEQTFTSNDPEALERLNSEIEKRKARFAERMTHAQQRNIHSSASVMPEVVAEVVAAFEKAKAHVAKFAEEIRPAFDAAEPGLCLVHGTRQKPDWETTLRDSWAAKELVRLVINYEPCPECEAVTARLKAHARWERRGVPHKLLYATFENFDARDDDYNIAKAKATAWRSVFKQYGNGCGFVILYGSVGTGKSHLAVAALKAMGDGLFITHADLVAGLRATYSSQEPDAQRRFFARYQSAPALVLDEIGVRSAGRDEEDLLYRVLAHRYDRDLFTVLTSNDELETIKSILGFRLVDRIAENSVRIACDWPSHRRVDKLEREGRGNAPGKGRAQ